MLKRGLKRYLQGRGKVFLLILLGTISWSLVMVKSGIFHPAYGIGFWGPNGHDGIWHIALSRSLARGSWEMPVFSGEPLVNYHIGFDLLLALIHKITQIPVNTLYFQIIPPVLAFLVGSLVYKLVFDWTKSLQQAFWSTFFVYFGGSWAYLLGKGESAFWSQQAVSTLVNPPFALSLVFLLLGMIFLIKEEKKLLHYVLCSVCFGLLIQIKAYAGLLALGGLLIAGMWEVLKTKKFGILVVFVFSLIVSVILFLPMNGLSGSLLVFKPFWFLETMMGLSDRIGWLKFGEAMVNYKLAGNLVKGVPAYLLAFVIFWFGNLGTRALALVKTKMGSLVEVFMYSVIAAGLIGPMFFLQEGTPWNTVQFFYYSLFFSGILAGVSMAKVKSRLIVAGIVFLTIPTTAITLKDSYLPSRPPSMVSTEELGALRYLEKQGDGVVLTFPFVDKSVDVPEPLYHYVSSAYVSAFTNKNVYLEDEVNLDITSYPWRERRQDLEKFSTTTDKDWAKNFLKENKIKYLYLVRDLSPNPGELLKIGPSQLGVREIYSNVSASIFEVQ